MRYGIFSDVHSNLEALEAVTMAYQQEKVDVYLCLGDIVGYAADPLDCIKRVREICAVSVAGNHDWAAAGMFAVENFNPQAAEAVFWTRGRLDDQARSYLASLKLIYQNNDLTLAHSTLANPEQFQYLYDTDFARLSFNLLKTDACFLGHTHIPYAFIQDKGGNLYYEEADFIRIKPHHKYIINAGSVGQPRDHDPRAAYCVYDTNTRAVQIKRIKYDTQSARAKILACGLPVFFGERLKEGK